MPKFWSHITIEIEAANAEVAERIAVGQQQTGYVIRSDAHYLPSVGDIVTVKRPSSGVRDESQLRAGLTYDHTEYQVVKTENFISMGATDIRKIDWVKGLEERVHLLRGIDYDTCVEVANSLPIMTGA